MAAIGKGNATADANTSVYETANIQNEVMTYK